MAAIHGIVSTAGTLLNSYGHWALIAIGYWKFIRPCSEYIDILKGKNIEQHTEDAPKALKELSLELHKAHERWEQHETEAKRIAEKALGTFFSHSHYDELMAASGFFYGRNERALLNALSELYQKLQSPSYPDIESSLITCCSRVQEVVSKQQGTLIRVKEMGKNLLSKGMKQIIGHPREMPPHRHHYFQHPLHRLRAILERADSPLRARLLRFQLRELGRPEMKTDNLSERLDEFVKNRVLHMQMEDPKGFKEVCEKEGIDPLKVLSNGVQRDIDAAFVAYQQMRKLKPILPVQSTLPEELRWKTNTHYQTERTKTLDLAASMALYIFFSQRYPADNATKEGFYQTLSKCHSLEPSARKAEMLMFFEKERSRLGGAWLPWAVDRYLFDSLYCTIKESISKFLSETPFFQNIRDELKDSPVPTMVYLGEKTARFFHYLTRKYAEWSENYAYDLDADRFLEKKLYKRQEHAQGHLNVEFFLSRYNLVKKLQDSSTKLKTWSFSPCFSETSFLSLLNPPLVAIKYLGSLLPRLCLQLLKLPAIFLQWSLDHIYQSVVEQILVHTSLLDKVDEVITESILWPSPYQFPLLEVLLKNLQEISEIIDHRDSDTPPHAQNDRAKRALQEAVRTFVAFAKTQESLDTTTDSNEQLLFEKILPFAMDKVFETALKVHGAYIEGDDFEKRKTEYLQAFNFYVYKKWSAPSNEEALLERHEEVKQQIAFYMRKIIQALVVQTSKEELSPDIGKMIERLFSHTNGSDFSPLKKSYLERKRALVVDVLKKSYIMKGLFLHILTQDKDI